jgi:CheY-like chemotaxis protein
MAAKILFVDDDPLVVKSIERFLKKAGYRVCAVRSGREALKKIQEEDFDLIVCDVRMPGMGGLETIERAREYFSRKGKPHPPEILISGYDSQGNLQKARALKVAEYIYKPFDLKDFLSVVDKALLSSSLKGEKTVFGRPVTGRGACAQRVCLLALKLQ